MIEDCLEAVDIEQAEKIKYRYQFMDDTRNLIFRYDNAPHYIKITSFPHHKHTVEKVNASREPGLSDILQEISQKMRS